MSKYRTTSRDIAEAAGTSQATVSRALRNSPLVRAETRARILEIAKKLNYRVDRSAAGLRTRHSRTLALLLFEDTTTDESMINPFFMALLSSITRVAAALDYDVLVSFQQLSEDWVARYEVSNRADGLILLGYGDYVRFAEKLKALKESEAHVVLWGPVIPGEFGYACGCDNAAGGRIAVEHLLGKGRRRIAFLGGASRRFPEFRARYEGYREALQYAGIEIDDALCVDADNTVAAGHAAARSLLDSGAAFDAVFAASDLIAIGAITAIRKAGRAVPDDINVVGFDDLPLASYTYPKLTTVRQDTLRAGELLVGKLIDLIEGKTIKTEMLAPQLIVRES